jgi:hypothetical protein
MCVSVHVCIFACLEIYTDIQTLHTSPYDADLRACGMRRYGHTSDGAVTEADAELPGTMVVRAQGALSHMSTVLPSPKGTVFVCVYVCTYIYMFTMVMTQSEQALVLVHACMCVFAYT